jgi:hypothetical protein
VRWRSLTASLLAVPALAGTGAASSAPRGGLYGVVMRGPTMPVCMVGKPCSAPAKGVVLVFVRAGRVAARVTTALDGRYRVVLAGGAYSVRTAVRTTIGRGLEPRTVAVPRNRFARLDFLLDTGIR